MGLVPWPVPWAGRAEVACPDTFTTHSLQGEAGRAGEPGDPGEDVSLGAGQV